MPSRAVFAALLLVPVVALARNPIVGTWKTDPTSHSQAGALPLVLAVDRGTYECVSCPVPYSVKMDGKEQPVAGDDLIDAVAVRLADKDTVVVVTKRAGKVVAESTMKLDADRSGFTRTVVSPGAGGKPSREVMQYKRVASAHQVDHWLSGSWRRVAFASTSAARVTFKEQDGALSMSSPDGPDHYTARLDGTPAPLKGSMSNAMVSVRMKDARTMEEVVTRAGQPWMTTVMTVDATGNKATVTWTHERIKAWEAKYRRAGDGASTAGGSYTMTRQ